jgi:hypothetical protein
MSYPPLWIYLGTFCLIAEVSKFVRKFRRASNRALVYVDGGPEKFLLIAILPEPTAHDVSRMQTPQDKLVMNRFTEIAEAFIYTGQVIA